MISDAELRERYQYHLKRGDFAETLYLYRWLRRRGGLTPEMVDPLEALERAEAIPFYLENADIESAVAQLRWLRERWPAWRREGLARRLAELEGPWQVLGEARQALAKGDYVLALAKVGELKGRGWADAEVLGLEREATVRARLGEISGLVDGLGAAPDPAERMQTIEGRIAALDRGMLAAVRGAGEELKELQGKLADKEKRWLLGKIEGLLAEEGFEEAAQYARQGAAKYAQEGQFSGLMKRLTEDKIKRFREGLASAEAAAGALDVGAALRHVQGAYKLFPESRRCRQRLEALQAKAEAGRKLRSALERLEGEYNRAEQARAWRGCWRAARQMRGELSAPGAEAVLRQEEIGAWRRLSRQRAKQSLGRMVLSCITGEALVRRLPSNTKRLARVLPLLLALLFVVEVGVGLARRCQPVVRPSKVAQVTKATSPSTRRATLSPTPNRPQRSAAADESELTQTAEASSLPTSTLSSTTTPSKRATVTPSSTRTITRTPTLTETPTPAVDPHFRADKTTIKKGECTTLRWDVEGVREVNLEGTGVAGHGQQKVCPGTTQTFTLEVVQQDGLRFRWRLTVEVSGKIEVLSFAVEHRGCLRPGMNLGQVKGQIFDRNGQIIVNAHVEITVDGQSGVVPVGRSNGMGWYEFTLRHGQVAKFVRVEVNGRNVTLDRPGFQVTAQSWCYERVDFRQR